MLTHPESAALLCLIYLADIGYEQELEAKLRKRSPYIQKNFWQRTDNRLFAGRSTCFLNYETSYELQKIVESLLTSEKLIKHAFFLSIFNLIISALLTRHLKTDSARTRLNYIHSISSEIGSTFLAILRTGLGAILGFLFVTVCKSNDFTAKEIYTSATAHASLAFITTVGFAFLQEILSTKHFKSHYKNELTLSIHP